MNFRKEDIFNSIGDPFEDRIRELKNSSVEVIGTAHKEAIEQNM